MQDLFLRLARQELGSLFAVDTSNIDRFVERMEAQLARRCTFALARGRRKGEACDRRCPGQAFCKTHTLVHERPGCIYIFHTGRRRNEMCKRRVRDGGQFCGQHREPRRQRVSHAKKPTNSIVQSEELVTIEPPTDMDFTDHHDPPPTEGPDLDDVSDDEEEDPILSQEDRVDFCPTYSNALQSLIDDPTIPRIEPTESYDSDDDEHLDTSDLTEIYAPNRSWGCQYWMKDLHFFCLEPTVVEDQFCAKHKRYAGKIPYKLGPHNYPLLEIDPVYYKTHTLTGQYWYPRLLLSAKPTSEGLIVIGRLLGQRWIQSLTRREIKRCHNNGLLYKVLPQEVVHYNYHIPDLETIPGQGFTSFEQLRRQRPKLYLKYWRIWNRHITDRQVFFERYRTFQNAATWRKEHTCPLPDWVIFEREFAQRGLKNVIVTPPSLEQVQDPSFDAWEYCDTFAQPDRYCFPPFYLDYPDPLSMRFRPLGPTPWQEDVVNVHTPRRIKHYTRRPHEWLERITTEGREWMQIYF